MNGADAGGAGDGEDIQDVSASTGGAVSNREGRTRSSCNGEAGVVIRTHWSTGRHQDGLGSLADSKSLLNLRCGIER